MGGFELSACSLTTKDSYRDDDDSMIISWTKLLQSRDRNCWSNSWSFTQCVFDDNQLVSAVVSAFWICSAKVGLITESSKSRKADIGGDVISCDTVNTVNVAKQSPALRIKCFTWNQHFSLKYLLCIAGPIYIQNMHCSILRFLTICNIGLL